MGDSRYEIPEGWRLAAGGVEHPGGLGEGDLIRCRRSGVFALLVDGALLEVAQDWAGRAYAMAWLPWPMTAPEAAAVLAAGAWPSGVLVDPVVELDPLRVLASGAAGPGEVASGAALAARRLSGLGPCVGPMLAL